MSDQIAPDLRGQLEPAYSESEIADAWRGIAAARTKTRRRWITFAVPAFAMAAAAVIAIIALRAPSVPAARALQSIDPVSVAAGAEVEAREPERGQRVALDDGSQVQLAPRTKLQVLANDGDRFTMFLERGTIDVAVKPGGPRRWEIETALATVEAVGSVFRVARYEHRIVVSVERGDLIVRGERVKGRVQRLAAGQELVLDEIITANVTPPSTPPTSPPSTPPTEPRDIQPAGDREQPPAQPPVESAKQPTAPPSLASTPPSPTQPTMPTRPTRPTKPTISKAIFDADQLRSSDPAAAAKLLEDAIAALPDDPSAGLARFALGRLYLESLGTPHKAIPLFRTIVERGSPHSLLEDAHARLVEALLQSGDAAAAKAAFAEYERLYPRGRRLAALRAML